MTWYRGKLYWSPGCVRIAVNGRMLDLGKQSLASASVVAAEYELQLIVNSTAKAAPGKAVEP